MVVRVSGKPIKVQEEDDKNKVDWFYLVVTCIGYGFIWWIMDLAAKTFLGGF